MRNLRGGAAKRLRRGRGSCKETSTRKRCHSEGSSLPDCSSPSDTSGKEGPPISPSDTPTPPKLSKSRADGRSKDQPQLKGWLGS